MAICRLCADVGMDSLEVSGNGTSVIGIRAGENEAYFMDFASQLVDDINIPVILVGAHRSIENMEKELNESKIEFLSLSRPLVREPDLPRRWQSGDHTHGSCAYTVVNIPLTTILPRLTSDDKERTILVTVRMICSMVGATIATTFRTPLVNYFGKGNQARDYFI